MLEPMTASRRVGIAADVLVRNRASEPITAQQMFVVKLGFADPQPAASISGYQGLIHPVSRSWNCLKPFDGWPIREPQSADNL
jgi:hypothetical protein